MLLFFVGLSLCRCLEESLIVPALMVCCSWPKSFMLWVWWLRSMVCVDFACGWLEVVCDHLLLYLLLRAWPPKVLLQLPVGRKTWKAPWETGCKAKMFSHLDAENIIKPLRPIYLGMTMLLQSTWIKEALIFASSFVATSANCHAFSFSPPGPREQKRHRFPQLSPQQRSQGFGSGGERAFSSACWMHSASKEHGEVGEN